MLRHNNTHSLINTNTHAWTHSTNEDGNLTVSLLSFLPVSLPPAVTKSKKFEVLSFILSQCWTVPGSQAIKHNHHFTPSVLFKMLHHYFPSLAVSCSFQVSLIEPLPIITARYGVFPCVYMRHIHTVNALSVEMLSMRVSGTLFLEIHFWNVVCQWCKHHKQIISTSSVEAVIWETNIYLSHICASTHLNIYKL